MEKTPPYKLEEIQKFLKDFPDKPFLCENGYFRNSYTKLLHGELVALKNEDTKDSYGEDITFFCIYGSLVKLSGAKYFIATPGLATWDIYQTNKCFDELKSVIYDLVPPEKK